MVEDEEAKVEFEWWRPWESNTAVYIEDFQGACLA